MINTHHMKREVLATSISVTSGAHLEALCQLDFEWHSDIGWRLKPGVGTACYYQDHLHSFRTPNLIPWGVSTEILFLQLNRSWFPPFSDRRSANSFSRIEIIFWTTESRLRTNFSYPSKDGERLLFHFDGFLNSQLALHPARHGPWTTSNCPDTILSIFCSKYQRSFKRVRSVIPLSIKTTSSVGTLTTSNWSTSKR